MHTYSVLILTALSWDLSLPSFHHIFPPLFVTMKPLIFTFYFTVEGYNVYVAIELFPHINVMMAESTVDSIEQNTQ